MTDTPTKPQTEPLSDEERQSFRRYAEENDHESNGEQSQWSDYVIRLIDERDRIANEKERDWTSFCVANEMRDRQLSDLRAKLEAAERLVARIHAELADYRDGDSKHHYNAIRDVMEMIDRANKEMQS